MNSTQFNKDIITVIVPVCSFTDDIFKCFESIINQTFKNIEVLFINNNRNDLVESIIDYFKDDNRIKIINNNKDKDINHLRNVGIQEAGGEYICFINIDDYLENDYLEKLYNNIRSSNSDISVCACSYIGSANNAEEYYDKEFYQPLTYMNNVRWYEAVSLNNKLYKKELFNNLSLKKELFKEDSIIHHIIFKANKLIYTSKPLYHCSYNYQNALEVNDSSSCYELYLALLDRIKLLDSKKIYEARNHWLEKILLVVNRGLDLGNNQEYWYNLFNFKLYEILNEYPQANYFIGNELKLKNNSEKHIINYYNNSLSDGFVPKAKVAIITNEYPDENNLYNNMFVHSRVKAYLKENLDCFVIKPVFNHAFHKYEYDGVEVLVCDYHYLDKVTKEASVICIHRFNKSMLSFINNHLNDYKYVVWSHGYDIYPYWRRLFRYENEIPKAVIERSDNLLVIWNELFEMAQDYNIHHISVSKTLQNDIKDEYVNFNDIPHDKKHVIHNYVDTEYYQIEDRKIEDRLNILSVSSFATNTYANDISVNCILELSKRPVFNKLKFKIVGDGVLFDELTKPLKGFENVELFKGFYNRDQLLEAFKEYGIFLSPKRAETQGVTRCEAMSCGLVPVTSNSGAIAEFCDDDCAILCNTEDYIALADAIEWLYNNPDQYLEMSRNARKKMVRQVSKKETILKEIELIYNH